MKLAAHLGLIVLVGMAIVEIAAMVQRAVGLSDWATGLGVGVMWAVLGCIIVGLLVAGEA